MLTDEEQCNSAWTGMGTDDRSDLGEQSDLRAVALLQDVCKLFCFFLAIAVGNKDGRILFLIGKLRIFVCQRLDRFLSAAGCGDLDQMSFAVHLQDRLDSQKAAGKSDQRTDTATAL